MVTWLYVWTEILHGSENNNPLFAAMVFVVAQEPNNQDHFCIMARFLQWLSKPLTDKRQLYVD